MRTHSALLASFTGLLLACAPESRQPTGTIDVRVELLDDGRIVGTYAGDRIQLSFSSTPAGEGAVARFEGDLGDDLVVELLGHYEAVTSWGGQTFTGRGLLSPAQLAALAGIDAEVKEALARIAHQAGCAIAGGVADAQMAALLVPWQLMIKYDPAPPSLHDLEHASACKYLAEGEVANQRGIELVREHLIPTVFGYFPFDGEGGIERAIPYGHEAGSVCGAICRGACGGDCDADSCTQQAQPSWCDGSYRVEWIKWRCSTHAGCREHDGCYDCCNATYGCGSWTAAACRSGGFVGNNPCTTNGNNDCDGQCIDRYGYTTCANWANGGGQSDGFITYEPGHETSRTWDSSCNQQSCQSQCSAQGATCGTISGGCNCGTCPSGWTCNAYNNCECVGTAYGQCGWTTDTCGNQVYLGNCPGGYHCEGNWCQPDCVPTSCGAQGATCGWISDGCGGSLYCGGCPSGWDCNAYNNCECVGTVSGQCGWAQDSCGNWVYLGDCPSGYSCDGNWCQWVDPCGGDPCCGDPCCGDPCCGDPCCGDPCCGDPCCGGCGNECDYKPPWCPWCYYY